MSRLNLLLSQLGNDVSTKLIVESVEISFLGKVIVEWQFGKNVSARLIVESA